MSLVTVATYRDVTGDLDTADATVTARIEEATDLIETDVLDGRALESISRTETLYLVPDPEGFTSYRAYPRAYPITAIPADSTYRIEDAVTLADLQPDNTPFAVWGGQSLLKATVTWTGGFTADTLPTALKRAICELARALVSPSPVPVGATSIRLGDAQITYQGATEGIDAYVPGITDRLEKYRRRRRLSW